MKQIVAILFAAALAIPAAAQDTSCATPGTNNDFLGIQTIRLWPGPAPEAKGTTCDDIPALTIFEPRQGAGKRIGGDHLSRRRLLHSGRRILRAAK